MVHTDRRRFVLFALSTFPFVIGLLIAYGVKGTEYIGDVVGRSHSYSLAQMVLEAIVSTTLGVTVVFLLFWALGKRGRAARRVMVAFLVSPILGFTSIFIGQTFLLILFKGSSNVFAAAVLVISLGVSMLSIVMIMIDAIPSTLRNAFVAFYGGVFGTFLGVTMITTSMIVVVVSLIVEDFVLTRYSPAVEVISMTDRIGSDPFDYTRIQSESVAVGVGDYVAFSLIAAHAFVFFPMHVWVMSLSLAVVGVLVNVFILAPEEGVLPAIPLPAAMAVFPWIVHIIALSMAGG